jgi:hypothetical protein
LKAPSVFSRPARVSATAMLLVVLPPLSNPRWEMLTPRRPGEAFQPFQQSLLKLTSPRGVVTPSVKPEENDVFAVEAASRFFEFCRLRTNSPAPMRRKSKSAPAHNSALGKGHSRSSDSAARVIFQR